MRFLYLLIFSAFFLPVDAVYAENIDQNAFTLEMQTRFKKLRPTFTFIIKEPLVLDAKDAKKKDEMVINLHRIHYYCSNNSKEDCDREKQVFAENLVLDNPKPQKENLRLIVRSQEMIDSIKEMFANSNKSQSNQESHLEKIPVYRKIGDDIYAVLVADFPKTTAYMSKSELKNLSLSEDEAWSLALKQTYAKLPQLPVGEKLKKTPMVYQDMDYLPSLIVDRLAWSKIAADAGPDLFVTIVSDGFVFVGTMSNGQKFDDFKKSVQEDCMQQSRCISSNIYRYRNGNWVIAH